MKKLIAVPFIDFRIPGVFQSVAPQEDHNRRETIRKLSHQFETHLHSRSMECRLGKEPGIQPVQQEVEGNDSQHRQHRIFRNV